MGISESYGTYAELRPATLIEFHKPTVEFPPWTQPYANPFLPDFIDDGLNNLQRKPASILNRSAVFVHAFVRDRLSEPVDHITVRAMGFNAIKPCSVNSVESGMSVQRDVLLDFWARR